MFKSKRHGYGRLVAAAVAAAAATIVIGDSETLGFVDPSFACCPGARMEVGVSSLVEVRLFTPRSGDPYSCMLP